MKSKSVIGTSVGKKRKINQDNFYVNGFINKKRCDFILKSFFSSCSDQVLCICDGMGGESRGEEASYIAVKALDGFVKSKKGLINHFTEQTNLYIQKANDEICDLINKNNGELSGSTVALLCVSTKIGEAVAINVGDSKVFLYRNEELKKLSEDHNRAQSLVNLGIITEEEARTHKDKSKLTQHLGIFKEEMMIEPHVSDNIMLKKNDIFLICSDGLTDMMTDKDIIAVLKSELSLKKKCKKLLDISNENGGKDNITIILNQIL